MNYRSAVAEGKRLIKRSEADQWRLAELTWEVVQAGKSRRQWANDIERNVSTVATYYKVWETWGVAAPQHSRPPFANAYNGAREGSDEPLTRAESRGRREERQVPTRPEDRIEMASKLLADRVVAAALVTDNRAMTNLARAENDQHLEREQQRSRVRGQSEAEEMRLSFLLHRARKSIIQALQLAKDSKLNAEARTDVLADAEEVRTALEWFESLVQDGDTSWEQALADWTAEA